MSVPVLSVVPARLLMTFSVPPSSETAELSPRRPDMARAVAVTVPAAVAGVLMRKVVRLTTSMMLAPAGMPVPVMSCPARRLAVLVVVRVLLALTVVTEAVD